MRFLVVGLAVLFATLLCDLPTAHAQLGRDTLRGVVRSCVLAKRTLGMTFPCREVELGGAGAPGYVILQPPLSASHMVVSPTADIAGIERPELKRPEARVYWQAAFRARALTAAALGGRVPLSEIGLAVNSAGGRTQDYLHIHVDCVRPRVLAALRAHAHDLGANWTPFPVPFDGERFFARRFEASDALNPFAEAASLPGHPELGTVALAALSAPAQLHPEGGIVVMAAVGPYATAENLLDHSCRIDSGARARS